jgi:predicted CXXCH cytochrome family protein
MLKINFPIIILITIFFSVRATLSQANSSNSCINCHLQLEGEYKEPAVKISADRHQQVGLSCAGCHGGDPTSDDPEIAMSPLKGFIGVPQTEKIPEFCGRCHSHPEFMRTYNPGLPTDQLEQYWTSVHGKLFKKGDPKPAQCISCHGVHDVREVSDPQSAVYAKNVPATCAKCHADSAYMAPYGIPTTQYNDYSKGVHGAMLLLKNDIGAPACNDCHGDHASTPPGFASVGRVCFQCHLAEGELFNLSPHKPAFDALEEEECVLCHSNHNIQPLNDEFLGAGEKSLCVNCHSEGDRGFSSAITMRAVIDSLSNKYQSAKSLITSAENKGVEVGDQLFQLKEVQDKLIETRKQIHSFNSQSVAQSANEGIVLAEETIKAGEMAMNEVKERRGWFAIFTLVTISFVILLIIKIKSIERT